MKEVARKTTDTLEAEASNVEMFLNDVLMTVNDTFHLSDDEQKNLMDNNVAKFIAALPFVAGCEDAKTKALSHLSIYLAEIRGQGSLCEESAEAVSTVYEDLGVLSTFDGGNQQIVQHGMSILALIMLEGYKDRTFSDMEKNIYNPLNDETWDYYTLKASLLEDIKESPYPELDNIILSKTGLLKNHF